jgi:hypothetical protein
MVIGSILFPVESVVFQERFSVFFVQQILLEEQLDDELQHLCVPDSFSVVGQPLE